jgi:hypothetical protein
LYSVVIAFCPSLAVRLGNRPPRLVNSVVTPVAPLDALPATVLAMTPAAVRAATLIVATPSTTIKVTSAIRRFVIALFKGVGQIIILFFVNRI